MLLKRGTGSGEPGAWNGERKSGNELSAETSTKIQNSGPKNDREKEEDKERNSCLVDVQVCSVYYGVKYYCITMNTHLSEDLTSITPEI